MIKWLILLGLILIMLFLLIYYLRKKHKDFMLEDEFYERPFFRGDLSDMKTGSEDSLGLSNFKEVIE